MRRPPLVRDPSLAAAESEERAESAAYLRGEWSCGEYGSSDEECTLEEIELRAAVARAVMEEGVAGRRRRVIESEWGGCKVPKLRDKSSDE